jgi:hypothetical protein
VIAARVLLAVFALSSMSLAQQSPGSLPAAPSVAFSTRQPGPFANAELSAQPKPPVAIVEGVARRRIVTKGFVAWTLADGATIAADAITTVHCLSLPNCVEKNPMFGSHPSVQRVAATEAAFFASDTLLSYWLKRKGKSWWWVPALANTAQGGVAAGLNLRHW